MPFRPTIPGRSFLGHTALRRPLPDLDRGLSADKNLAVPAVGRRMAQLIRQEGTFRSTSRPGHWTGVRIEEIDIEIGGRSNNRPEFVIETCGQIVFSGRFPASAMTVSRDSLPATGMVGIGSAGCLGRRIRLAS